VTSSLRTMHKRFIVAATVMGILDVCLLFYLLWPGFSASARIAQEQQLQQRYKVLQREVAPLLGLDKKLPKTREDIRTFYQQSIPGHYSQISLEVERLVRETGVSTQGVHYLPQRQTKGDLPGVQPIEIDTTISGDYSKVARFINALEQDKLFFVIDQIALSSLSETGGQVTLQIKFETFVKETGQASGA
jgi:Tfp pilus assembly protein PilO